jgi:hypothetical protein
MRKHRHDECLTATLTSYFQNLGKVAEGFPEVFRRTMPTDTPVLDFYFPEL